MKTTPYTYHIFNTVTQQHYYGVRYSKNCHPNDLWVTYFTSSKYVQKLIDQYGKDSFIFEVRKTFDTPEAALAWEHKVLRRLKVRDRLDWLNRVTCSARNKTLSIEHRLKISENNRKRKGNIPPRKLSEEHKQKIRLSKLGSKNPNYGKVYTVEEKQRHSEKIKGQKRSKETCMKLREAARRNGNDGKHMSYLRSLIKDRTHGAAKRRGQKRTAEQRQRMSEAHRKTQEGNNHAQDY